MSEWLHVPQIVMKLRSDEFCVAYMGVSLNGGTPKWMVYNGKPY